MRTAVIILRLDDDHAKVRVFPSATEAKSEFKALRSAPPSGAVEAELWTSDTGRVKRQKFNRKPIERKNPGPEKVVQPEPEKASEPEQSKKTVTKPAARGKK